MASSGVTYTYISSDYEDPSDVGSPGVNVYGYDGLLMHQIDPPSPDYEPGPEEPEQAPLSPDYVPRPEYPKYLALSDEEVPIEDEPYAAADSPIALSRGYITDSNPKEDPNDESDDGPVDYPADGRDDDEDDNDDDSSRDDANDEDEEEAFDEEEEEEHLAPADSTAAASLVVDPIPFAEETEPFETDESAATPPPSPLTPLSSPLPQIPSPRLSVPSPLATSPTYAEAPLGFKAAEIRLRTASPLPSPTSPPTHDTLSLPSPPLPPPVDRREDIPEADIPPWKRLCLTTPTSRFEEGESLTAVATRQPGLGATRTTDYGFVDRVYGAPKHHVPREVGYGIIDTWDELVDAIQEGSPTTLEGVNARVTELTETHERDTQDLYAHLEDAQDSQAHLSGRVVILIEDRQFHQQIVIMIEDEARVSREAWAQAIGCSAGVHYELQAYRAHTHIQDLRISSQEALTVTLVAQVSSLQSHLIAALGQIQALQARDPAHIDDPEDADSCKMASRRGTRTRTTLATATATTTTPMTDAAIKALIAQGVADALAGRPIQRNTNLNDDGS
ncbi:hypothetical protein Tco_1042380 [Tanacetum coccineum]|uniref:Uncharacterized protein n=1 Tax=Tanacetum coccineum TaxID=301880 RepID=A0ABQ5GJH1_9ASTR